MTTPRSPLVSALVLGLTLGPTLGLYLGAPAQAAADGDYRAAVDQWRKQADEKLRSADGPLAVIGLYWLHPGANQVGAYPSNEVVLPSTVAPAKAGILTVDGDTVIFEAGEGVAAKVDGHEVTRVELQRDGQVAQGNFNLGRVKLSFLNRELGLGIRVADPQSAGRTEFPGQQWFPVDENWVVEGRFVPFEAPKTLVYEAATGGTRTGASPGYVSFNRDGQEYRLEVQKSGDQGYSAYFFDATTGKTTYAGGRAVPIEKAEGDRVRIDFNKAFNLPCAVSAFFNCPIAPAQNRLTTLPVPAGEKKPLTKVARVASAPEYLK